MKIYFPPIRKLIDYFQEKQVNIELGKIFVHNVGADCKRVKESLHDPDEKDQTENLAYLALLGSAYQKNPSLFVRPKEPSRLQKIMFSVSNRLDNIIAKN